MQIFSVSILSVLAQSKLIRVRFFAKNTLSASLSSEFQTACVLNKYVTSQRDDQVMAVDIKSSQHG
jgi:hypothetical protein